MNQAKVVIMTSIHNRDELIEELKKMSELNNKKISELKEMMETEMKVISNGRLLWLRIISSTIVGQFINTAVFYAVALGGVLPNNELVKGILAGWIIKTAIEVLFTPVTYFIMHKVKKIEGVDHYDRGTNFNPFMLKH